jgi:protein TonB
VAPPPAPPVEAVPVKPAGPITLGTELAVACPERRAPNYPPLSRRLGEEGKAVLRVELDEQGHVSAARVATASGFSRLDEAALAAVKTWRCNPARRDGQPVRAVALQPFKFVLQ